MPIDKDTKIRIEAFDASKHVYKTFDCGVQRLNNYLHRNAKDQHADKAVRVFVAVEDGGTEVLAYIVLNFGEMCALEVAKKPKGTPAHGKLPVLFVSRVATALSAAGAGIGSDLMDFSFQKAEAISKAAGCFAVLLDVLQDGSAEDIERRRKWYADMGFIPFASDPNRMYVTIAYIEQLNAHRDEAVVA